LDRVLLLDPSVGERRRAARRQLDALSALESARDAGDARSRARRTAGVGHGHRLVGRTTAEREAEHEDEDEEERELARGGGAHRSPGKVTRGPAAPDADGPGGGDPGVATRKKGAPRIVCSNA